MIYRYQGYFYDKQFRNYPSLIFTISNVIVYSWIIGDFRLPDINLNFYFIRGSVIFLYGKNGRIHAEKINIDVDNEHTKYFTPKKIIKTNLI